MRLVKACMLCQEKPGIHQCMACGKVVCDEHFVAKTGMCEGCSSGIMME